MSAAHGVKSGATMRRYGTWSRLWSSGATWLLLATVGVAVPVGVGWYWLTRASEDSPIVLPGAAMERVVADTKLFRPVEVTRTQRQRFEGNWQPPTPYNLLSGDARLAAALPDVETVFAKADEALEFVDATATASLAAKRSWSAQRANNISPGRTYPEAQLVLARAHAAAARGDWPRMVEWFERGVRALNETPGSDYAGRTLDVGMHVAMPVEVSDAMAAVLQRAEEYNRDTAPSVADMMYLATRLTDMYRYPNEDFSQAITELLNVPGSVVARPGSRSLAYTTYGSIVPYALFAPASRYDLLQSAMKASADLPVLKADANLASPYLDGLSRSERTELLLRLRMLTRVNAANLRNFSRGNGEMWWTGSEHFVTYLRLNRCAYLAKSFRTRHGRWPRNAEEIGLRADESTVVKNGTATPHEGETLEELLSNRQQPQQPITMGDLPVNTLLLPAYAPELVKPGPWSNRPFEAKEGYWVHTGRINVGPEQLAEIALAARAAQLSRGDRGLSATLVRSRLDDAGGGERHEYTAEELERAIGAFFQGKDSERDANTTRYGFDMMEKAKLLPSGFHDVMFPDGLAKVTYEFRIPMRDKVFCIWAGKSTPQQPNRPIVLNENSNMAQYQYLVCPTQ